ncbi:MAG: hypothetical protein MR567_03330, partial [Oscillospiraceae bacterium]|nr:hypothetical protein [Oscillospiraceae bacterium]
FPSPTAEPAAARTKPIFPVKLLLFSIIPSPRATLLFSFLFHILSLLIILTGVRRDIDYLILSLIFQEFGRFLFFLLLTFYLCLSIISFGDKHEDSS